MTKPKILILDNVHPRMKDALAEVFQIDENLTCQIDELMDVLPEYVGVILRSRLSFTREVIDAATDLKFIGRVGAGMESIDVEYAESKGIQCLNSPEGNRDAVAEHAMGMILSLLNHLNTADKEVRKGIWQREANRGRELKHMTVGVVGFGNMGSAFAQRLSGFGCRVLAYDKNKTNYAPEGVKEVKMLDLFEQADLISLHIPLDEANYYLCDEKWFEQFHKPIALINTARGPVVKTSALIQALDNGKVLAAGLDVLEYEETSFEKTKQLTDIPDFLNLAQRDNVLFSPHIAGWTVDSKIKLADYLVEKITVVR
ncbi:MAG: NAD(P)-dependent oxidoreductase [Bacteroidales bacterium]|jgi:D-3-phosphoglycerate dehydrogenase|nr:NAD(P)-dependent oxidoreductase [Bacteroidales bacterium]